MPDTSLDLEELYRDNWWLQRPRNEKEKEPGDVRNDLERDRDRITHSSALRRLSNKTQVIGSPWADGFRNRLTHTLEVSQIGRSIARRHRLDEALAEAACLGHDLGHPPFGHAGERCLNLLMKDHGGFDANAQTLRVLHSLEIKSSGAAGLNLTRAAFWSVLKYPYQRRGELVGEGITKEKLNENGLVRTNDGTAIVALNKYLYDEDLAAEARNHKSFGEWLGEGRFTFPYDPGRRLDAPAPRTAVCQIMNWSDDIAYAIHDFEDAVMAGFITAGSIARIRDALFAAVVRDVGIHDGLEDNFEFWHLEIDKILQSVQGHADPGRRLRPATRDLLGKLIDGTNVVAPAADDGTTLGYSVRGEPRSQVLVSLLSHLGFELMIRDERIVRYFRKGTMMLERAFGELWNDPKVVDERCGQLLPRSLMPDDWFANEQVRARKICDFLASMSEPGLTRFYQTLFESTGGSPFR